MRASDKKMNNKKSMNILLVVIGVLLAGFIGFIGADVYSTAIDLKSDVSILKKQFQATVDSLENEDISTAKSSLAQVNTINAEMHEEMNRPLMKLAAAVSGQVRSANTLLDIVDDASTNVISPAIDTLNQYPMSQLKVGEDGFNVTLINSYLNMAESIMPHITNISDELNTVNISIEKDKIEEYKQKLNDISSQYDQIKDFFPVLHAILGDGSDRYYLFPVQNTAEIRALGGFPGSVGSITISNGVLIIGDFNTPYDVLADNEEGDWTATPEEVQYFSELVTTPRDAGYIPDFPRAAYIWAKAKEADSGQYVDGVISMTPVMVQKMLGAVGQSITLSDGTVIDGTNATKYLQYDIYDQYFDEYSANTANNITDALFAETAEKAMSTFVSAFSFKNLMSYMPLISGGIDDRELMFWFANDTDEQAVRSAGCAGSLNDGVDNNKVGVYLSLLGSKCGWFIDINNQVLDQIKNDDGTTTYHVQTDVVNNITQDIVAKQNPYILAAATDGGFYGYLQVVAPYGGTISDVTCDGQPVSMGQYNGNQLAYDLGFKVYPQSSSTLTYTITTANDVTDELSFAHTPTLTEYRQAAGQ